MFNHKQKTHTGNTKGKSNRYSILMLALIFIGFATYGTYAYFTDSTSVGNSLELSTGTVSLKDVPDGEWAYAPESNNKNLKISNETGTSFSNAQPGDTFSITKEVKYTGSLDANLSVSGNKDLDTQMKSQGLKYEIHTYINDEESPKSYLEENDTIFVRIKITIDNSFEETYKNENRNTGDYSFDLNVLSNAVTLTVKQK